MNRLFFLLMAMLLVCSCTKPEPDPVYPPSDNTDTTTVSQDTTWNEPLDNIYQFTVLDGNGDSVSLGQYRGKVLLVVNSATQCGYTPQYTRLEQWYEDYQDQGFVILDFPCNQFGSQAPGTYDDIHDFCTVNYHISVPQFDKILVNGPNASPLYVWLKSKKPGNIQWNFTKFLIDRNGEVVERFEPNYNMNNVQHAIEAQLGR